MQRVFLISLFGTVAVTTALADFSYEQTTQMTGGSMMAMLRMAGPLAGKAREPQKSTVIVKGNKMVHVYADHAQIIDLDSETFTDVKFKDKTYSVITFAQMRQAMDAMAQRMGQAKPDGEANLNAKMDVKETGQTKVISGLNASEKIMTVTFETTDPKTGQKGAMVVVSDMWMAADVPGYAEVREFQQRMGQKIALSAGAPNVAALPGAGAGMGQGMALMAKEAAKLQGVPVLQVTKMGSEGMDLNAGSGAPGQQQQQMQPQGPPPPSGGQVANDAARSAASSAITSRMGRAGAIGGALGGFGRKKKTEEAPPPPPTPQAPPVQQAPAAAPAGAGPLMETTTELTGFSSTADVSKLSVPAGYKQVEHDMLKMIKK